MFRLLLTFLTAAFFLTALNSCKTEQQSIEFIIKGRLLDSCNGQPVPNTNLTFWQDYWDGGKWHNPTPEKMLSSFVTGADGSFSFVNKSDGSADYSVRNDAGQLFSGRIAANKNLDIGEVFVNKASASVQYILQNNKPFEAGDSVILFYLDQDLLPNVFLKITGKPGGDQWIYSDQRSLGPKSISMDSPPVYRQFITIVASWRYATGNWKSTNHTVVVYDGCSANQVTLKPE